jgi:hypothetical protein
VVRAALRRPLGAAGPPRRLRPLARTPHSGRLFPGVRPGHRSPQRLAAKLPGYLALAQASGIATPLLLWLPTPAREAATRQALSGSSLPVATATSHPGHTPAGPLWLPLQASGPRRRLAQLARAW